MCCPLKRREGDIFVTQPRIHNRLRQEANFLLGGANILVFSASSRWCNPMTDEEGVARSSIELDCNARIASTARFGITLFAGL